MDERQTFIIEYLQAHGFATADELAEVLKVSPITVRREFSRLEQGGFIKRVHGGAMPPDHTLATTHISFRLRQNETAKREIAQYAVRLIQPHDIVFLDAGSTCMFVTEYLPDNLDVTIITHALDNMNVLRKKSRVKLIAIGGEFNETLGAFVGPTAEIHLEQLSADKAFLGAAGLNPSRGCVNNSLTETKIKRQMNSQSREPYILADSSKFGKDALHNTIPVSDMRNIITDTSAPPDQVDAFIAVGVKVEIAPKEQA